MPLISGFLYDGDCYLSFKGEGYPVRISQVYLGEEEDPGCDRDDGYKNTF